MELLTENEDFEYEAKKCVDVEPSDVVAGCEPDFDSVLCWPKTTPGTLAVLPCFFQLNGINYDTSKNATRLCLTNGSWDIYTDYSSCRELPHPIADTEEPEIVELTTRIYFGGYVISLSALMVAVFIFCKYKDLRCLRNKIHMNLMLSYTFSDFVWIMTFMSQIFLSSNVASCVLFIISLHYFHLTNFFWMFIEGLYLYILVVKTFRGDSIRLKACIIIGWGFPAVFVFLWGVAKSVALYSDVRQVSCPWRSDVVDWVYQVPAIAVLFVNSLFLIVIMWVLITKLRSANSAETQQYRKAAKALLVLIPLLGMTYIFVLLGPTEGTSRRIYECIRAVLLSTQGFTVALLYCFLNTEVRNTVGHHLNAWNTHRSLRSRSNRCSSRDWTPRSRDSLRLYQAVNFFKKRESATSVGTTTSLVALASGKSKIRRSLKSPTEVT